MECHKCEHQAAVKAGKYEGVPYLDTPCGKCKVKTESSAFTIAYDSDRESAADPVVQVPFASENAPPGELLMPSGVLAEFVNGLLLLSSDQREIVCLRHAGLPYKDIAAKLGSTVAAVEQNHRRAFARWPYLREMFLEKSRKQSRRRKPGATPQRVESMVRHGAGWRSAGGGFERTTMTPDFNDHDHRQTLYRKAG